MRRKHFLLLLSCIFLLTSCGRSDPQVVLDATVKELQMALEAKKTNAALDILHPDFSAQQGQNDREWAKRTMALMFMRYQNVKVIALSQKNRIDPKMASRAYTDAEVALTGAEGLIPDSARHYRVQLEWRLVDKEWKLIAMQWE